VTAAYEAAAVVAAEEEAPEAGARTSAVTPTSGVAAIKADQVWALGATGEGIVVSNIDSGVSRSNPSVKAAYRGAASGSYDYNWHAAAREGRTAPGDGDGHGTHVMGTMVGGVGTASTGSERAFGVAPDARWIATNGCADLCADAALIRSGQWILAPTKIDGSGANPAMRPHVVNNSWGLPFSKDPFMEDVITAWEAAGIFAAFANGNEGEYGCDSSGAPGARSVTYSVGALKSDGSVAEFSSRGPGQSGSVKPDITAPGVAVQSAAPGRTTLVPLSGTSMAAPHLAGAVALLWSAVPELVGDVLATREILDRSAVNVGGAAALACGGTTANNNVYGEGRLDVLAAYGLAQDMEFDATQTPVVTGTAQVGATLTAVADGTAWSPAASLTYQWRRAAPSTTGPGQMISGATKSTYKLQPEDAGKQITVTVLGTAGGRLPTSVTSERTATVATATMNGSPTMSGSVRVGATLQARSGTGWPSGTRFTYQWKANGTAISGATGFAYKPTTSMRGKRLTVTITANRQGYKSVTKTVGGTTVGYGVFEADKPYITGAPVPGATVYAKVPGWAPSRSRTTYQWKANGYAISGATGSSYRVPAKHQGKTLTVTVKGSRDGYTSKSVTSAGRVVGKAFSSSPTPTIAGTKTVGAKLTAGAGTWRPGPSGLSYQWYADGRPISGATGKTLALKGPQVGKKITVAVTAKRSGYAATTRVSAATTAIAKPGVLIRDSSNTVWTGVPAATYIAQAGASTDCTWFRLNSNWDVLGADTGYRQRILTVKSSDWAIASEGCNGWRRYFPGMVERKWTTATDGVYILGGHLERGTYVTSGRRSESGYCYYAFLKETVGNLSGSHVIKSTTVVGPTTITMPDGAQAFETAGCTWTRVN
jgi:subtilisin family serine protease